MLQRSPPSLTAPVPRHGLTKGNDATDQETLVALARESEIRDLARGRRLDAVARHAHDPVARAHALLEFG